MLIHKDEQAHSTTGPFEILPDLIGPRTIIEESPHVNDVLVRWEAAQHLVFILMILTDLVKERERALETTLQSVWPSYFSLSRFTEVVG